MLYHAHIDVYGAPEALEPHATRVELLHRQRRACEDRDLTLLAFHLRYKRLEIIVEGEHTAVHEALRAIKIGTSQALRSSYPDFMWSPSTVCSIPPDSLDIAVARCHRLEHKRVPLSTAWSSHRDLMGLRDAAFFDATALRARVSSRRVHRSAGGKAPKPVAQTSVPTLADLLQAAAETHGLMPADPKAFRLFVHLARLHGYAADALAAALAVTERRVRQLAADVDPMVPIGLAHLHDARLHSA